MHTLLFVQAMVQSQHTTTLPAFKSHFHGENFTNGTEVRLALSREGTVTTLVNGSRVRFAALNRFEFPLFAWLGSLSVSER